jgi:plastocyanin
VVLCVVALLLGACAERAATPGPATATVARSVAPSPSTTSTAVGSVMSEITVDANAGLGIIDIQAFQFAPPTLGIALGAAMVWRNKDGADHRITSGTGGARDGKFDFAAPAGKRVGFMFAQRGSYPYFCGIHGPSMSGTINVF